jgi:hypothetical protein
MPRGPKGVKRPRDPNQLAKLIVDIATGQVKDEVWDKKPRKRTSRVEFPHKKAPSRRQSNPGSPN